VKRAESEHGTVASSVWYQPAALSSWATTSPFFTQLPPHLTIFCSHSSHLFFRWSSLSIHNIENLNLSLEASLSYHKSLNFKRHTWSNHEIHSFFRDNTAVNYSVHIWRILIIS
jgi:hypothetical protein